MARIHHVRVAAVGSEADMRQLCRAMLSNAGWEDDLPGSLDALLETVRRVAAEEGGPECGFLYEMVTRRAYGDAEESASRFTVRQDACGLWTALFVYESQTPFQPEDWLRLHGQAGKAPMFVLRACDDFDRDKGLLVLSGGYVHEEWSHMEECWLWLTTRYGEDDPEGTVQQLRRLARLLEDEEDELTVPKLLERCGRLLTTFRDRASDAEGLRERLDQAVQQRDYQTLFALQCLVAQMALWEAENAPRWLACLEKLKGAL